MRPLSSDYDLQSVVEPDSAFASQLTHCSEEYLMRQPYFTQTPDVRSRSDVASNRHVENQLSLTPTKRSTQHVDMFYNKRDSVPLV